jgi:hypothetical protein
VIAQSLEVTSVILQESVAQKCGNNPVLVKIAVEEEDESLSYVIL